METRKYSLSHKLLMITGLFVLFFNICKNSNGQNFIKPTFPVFNNLEVNTFNGNLIYTRQDFIIKGNIPVNVSFYYNSVNDTVDFGYGSGWYFNYGMNYYLDSLNNVVLIQNGGRKDLYSKNGSQYLPPIGIYDQLTEYEPQKFVLTTKDDIKYFFADPGHKKLTSITDKLGNSITIAYSSGFPVTISNSSGKSVSLSWANNHLSGITFNSATYLYQYTDNHLNKVTNPKGVSESYQYLANGKISVIANYNNNPVYIEYNAGIVVNKIKSCLSEISFSFVENKSYVIENGSSGKLITCYTYDTNQRVIQVTTPNQKSVFYEYDNRNNVVKFTDFKEKATQFTYDANGNVLTTTNAAGFSELSAYNASNKIISSRDQKGNTTGFTYDNNGNLLAINQPLSASNGFTYDNTGNIIQATDPLGHSTGFTWDAGKNLVQIASPIGSVGMAYDIYGNLTQVTDPNGNSQYFEYTGCVSCGQVSKVKFNDTITNTFSYDGAGNLIGEIDANGNPKTFEYDGLNRINSVTIPAGTTDYQYDERSNLTRVTDANSHSTQYVYNSTNQVASEEDPLGKKQSYEYDANGDLVSETDANGNTIQYAYNSLNQLVQKTYPGNTDHFSYDEVGNMTSMYNNDINISFSYDALNRLITKKINNWNKTISYTYDKAGNRTSMTDPDGGITSYSYDANNRLISITNPFGETTSFEYDLSGRLLKQNNANGTYAEYTYNHRNLLTSLINKKSSGEKISGYQYTYDKAGNRLKMTVNDTAVHQYSYDASNRLTQVIYPSGETESFAYDGAGNRVSHSTNGILKNYSYNEADQLISDGNASYTFDNNGNMTGKTENGQTTLYSYNALNRLIRIQYHDGSENAFVYDPAGNRISMTNKAGQITKYLLDGDNVLAELNNSGNTQAQYTTALEVDTWISMHRGNQSYMFHKDGLNSTTSLSDASQGLSATYAYSAFGELKNRTVNIINPFTYTGREYDFESGIYHYRSRYYDQNIGRMLTRDRFNGLLLIPQSLNKYTYVENRPINYIDPHGYKGYAKICKKPLAIPYVGLLINSAFTINITPIYPMPFIKVNLLDILNIEPYHEQIFFFDENMNTTGNIGYPNLTNEDIYKCEIWDDDTYDGDLMREAVSNMQKIGHPDYKKNVITADIMNYDIFKNNCQDWIDRARREYLNLQSEFSIPVIRPVDPNEIIGPNGYDSLNWVSANHNLAYTVLFENDPNFATAPAQNVMVKVPVTGNLNMSDFRLGSFGFGKYNFNVPENSASYTNRLDLRDSLGLYVDVTAGLNVNTHEAFWLFESIDPTTGLPPANPMVGFLPVNDSTISPGPGEGFVSFTLKPKTTDQTGDSLLAQASIVFDNNAPIKTNTWINIVDVLPPVSSIDTINTLWGNNSFNLTFSGTDDPGGCGIASCQLYFSKDEAPYLFYGEFKPDTILKFTGSFGSTYKFFSRAKDHVGNIEPMKTVPDAIATIHSISDKKLNLAILLQGLYIGNGTMRKAQNEYGDQFPGLTADKITIELHSAVPGTYSSIIYSSGLIDMSSTGAITVDVPAIHYGSYYVTIKHRNSIETTTAAPVSFAGNSISYAFDAPAKAYGGNLLLMTDGRYVIYGGDVNQDGIVDTGDMVPVDNESSLYASGYLTTDVNGDGIIDTSDMIILDNNASPYISSITP